MELFIALFLVVGSGFTSYCLGLKKGHMLGYTDGINDLANEIELASKSNITNEK